MFEKNRIISHRGIHDNKEIFENTLEAFELAIKEDYIIELDIRLTKDKKIVVFHDINTKRITNKNMIIEESNYDELNNQNIIHIPLMEEVLNLVNGKVPLLIEIKPNKNNGEIESLLVSLLKKYKGKYAIQSFSPKTLYWFKRNHPDILRGQLASKFKKTKISSIKKIILRNMLLNTITKPNFISYKYNELSLAQIKKYQKKKVRIIGWTITNEIEYNHYKKYYDNLICEKFI